MNASRDTDRRALVIKLLKQSWHAMALQGDAEEIARVAAENHQIQGVLDNLLDDPTFDAANARASKQHRKSIALIEHVFEWMFFASEPFVERASRG
jgi:hydroxyethylthiazole kinase-like sugar kinase family protein